MPDPCRHCGKPASEHHQFEYRPDGCVCDSATWGMTRPIPPVCDAYREDNGISRCANCEHDAGCHKVKE